MLSLSALSLVNFVIVSDSVSANEVIKNIKPNVYFKGKDYKVLSNDPTKNIILEKREVEKYGGKIVFSLSELNSSSKLLFQNNMIFPEYITKFLSSLKKNISLKETQAILEKIKKLKVLVIGDTIIDNYIFCNTVGKASKDPMLVVEKKFNKKFLGGAASVALNCYSMCKNIVFFTKLGTKNKKNYNFVINKLKKINLCLIKDKSSYVNEKARYVDYLSSSKLIGVYELDKSKKNNFNQESFLKLKNKIKNFDAVVLLDYKHGLIDNLIAKEIFRHKNNYVNFQVNSSNRNNHNFDNFKNINCLVINEDELRNELKDTETNLNKLIKNFSLQKKIKIIIVTQGKNGSVMYHSKQNQFFEVPSFSTNVKDRVGAGDIIISIISLFLTVTNNYQFALTVASMFGAKAVENYGNENIVNSTELLKFASTFLD